MSRANGQLQPRPPERPARVLRRSELTLIVGSWSVYAVISTGRSLAIGYSPAVAATASIASAAVWASLTVLIFWLSRSFPLDRKPRLRSIVVHIGASGIVALLEVVASFGMFQAIGLDQPFMDHFLRGFPFDIAVYWMVTGVAHGLMYYRRYRQRDAEAALLATRLVHAELQNLKSQLQPHFLFNALNTISALMHRDVKAADRMLSRLGDLLRASLEHTSTQEVSLLEELNFLQSYLEIEQTRLADRLTVEMDIPHNVLDARVPHMILQPLVENAIRHGVAPRAGPGHVLIRARGRRDMLDLEVIDDGPGAPAGRSRNGGLGLANTRARLEQLYGNAFTFEPKNRAEGGFRVSLSIPFRPIDEETPVEQGAP